MAVAGDLRSWRIGFSPQSAFETWRRILRIDPSCMELFSRHEQVQSSIQQAQAYPIEPTKRDS